VLAMLVQRFRLDLVPGQTVEAVVRTTLQPRHGILMRPQPQDGHPERSPAAVRGNVVPVAGQPITLHAALIDGSVIEGQAEIARQRGIRRVWISPADVNPSTDALAAIAAADLIVIGPGSLYTSLLPPLLVPGIHAALCHDVYSAHQCVEHDDATVAHFGPERGSWVSWHDHTNRLVPVWTCGTRGRNGGVDLEAYTGTHSIYRDEAALLVGERDAGLAVEADHVGVEGVEDAVLVVGEDGRPLGGRDVQLFDRRRLRLDLLLIRRLQRDIAARAEQQ